MLYFLSFVMFVALGLNWKRQLAGGMLSQRRRQINTEQEINETNSDYHLENWMGTYGPIIKHLPLNKLCLVETHDAGTFRMKSPLVGRWATTQHATFQQQLCGGVRVLDLRVGCDVGPKDFFVLVHGKFRTATTLETALDTICDFVDRHPREVVILDFHGFVSLMENETFYWEKLQDLVVSKLKHHLYPNAGFIPTLEQIWKTSASRILVAWNATSGMHPSFFPGIHQGWYRTVSTVSELHAAIEHDLQHAEDKHGLWTVGAVLPAAIFRSVPSIPELGLWFFPGKEWTRKVNIIQADFVVQIGIVPNAIAQCILNGINEWKESI